MKIVPKTPTAIRALISWMATLILVTFMFVGTSFGVVFPRELLTAIQSKTWNGHDARFALDGDITSYSTAVGSNNSFPEWWKFVPWWEADMQYLHTVTVIVIIGPPPDGFSRGLNLFSADIIPASIMNSQYLPGSVQCGVITEIYVIPTYGRYSMTCIQYNFGRYVLIRKLRRSGSISLSEVEIHVRKLILF